MGMTLFQSVSLTIRESYVFFALINMSFWIVFSRAEMTGATEERLQVDFWPVSRLTEIYSPLAISRGPISIRMGTP